MRITRLFSSVLAGLALMYASGCSSNCEVAGYNVYGYPSATQAYTSDAAYAAAYGPGLAPMPNAVVNRSVSAPRARVKRSKVRARPTAQRFAQVNPYVYNQQPFAVPALNQAPMTPMAPVMQQTAPIVATNFGTHVPGTSSLVTNPDFVPTIVTNSQAAGYAAYAPQPVQQPYAVNTYAPAVAPAPLPAPIYNQVPAGSNVECRTVYRRGRPIRQRYRKVRWIPVGQPAQQQVMPAPVYAQPAPVYVPPPAPVYVPPPAPVYEPYVPPIEPIPYTPPIIAAPVEPVVISQPEPIVVSKPEPVVVNTVIEPVIQPTIQPRIQPVIDPVIEPQIKPVIEPTIRTRIEPTPVVDQPIQQPIVQPVVIQPIIQPIIQAPIQQQIEPAMIQAPLQVAVPEPIMVQQPVPQYVPPPMPQYVPPPAPVFAPMPQVSQVAAGGYCPPDVCPVPNQVVCQPGQNLSDCFTLNDYQIQNSPTQIYTPTASGPLPISYDGINAGRLSPVGGFAAGTEMGTASLIGETAGASVGGYSASATVMATPMGQMTTSKYEALPMPVAPLNPDFGMTQISVPSPIGQTDNIPPVPAASEIENALDAMLSRDQSPNLK